ncbi:MAG: hypothetical protein VYE81_08510, partial [Planctomycetota bacterium]|nr:hypothetical protein [Planctomycetota bacterium]
AGGFDGLVRLFRTDDGEPAGEFIPVPITSATAAPAPTAADRRVAGTEQGAERTLGIEERDS